MNQEKDSRPAGAEAAFRVKPRMEIRDRAFQYAISAIKLGQQLQKQKDCAAWIVGKQYPRSATSIGANIEEAQSAESRLDFIHKMAIAQKEARESICWLRLILGSQILPDASVSPLIGETNQLIAIITAILVKTKKRLPN
jgi:four helix bundle protein